MYRWRNDNVEHIWPTSRTFSKEWVWMKANVVARWRISWALKAHQGPMTRLISRDTCVSEHGLSESCQAKRVRFPASPKAVMYSCRAHTWHSTWWVSLTLHARMITGCSLWSSRLFLASNVDDAANDSCDMSGEKQVHYGNWVKVFFCETRMSEAKATRNNALNIQFSTFTSS